MKTDLETRKQATMSGRSRNDKRCSASSSGILDTMSVVKRVSQTSRHDGIIE